MRKIAILLFIFSIFAACKDNDTGTVIPEKPYDPSKPLVLTNFEPETGGLAAQVIINGSNFGTDPSKLKVYFNGFWYRIYH
jgi:hypothetical protein